MALCGRPDFEICTFTFLLLFDMALSRWADLNIFPCSFFLSSTMTLSGPADLKILLCSFFRVPPWPCPDQLILKYFRLHVFAFHHGLVEMG